MNLATIIIPVLDNDGTDNAPVIDQTLHAMIDMHGGATVWNAEGFWKSDEGKLYKDDVKIIQSATTAKSDAFMDELAGLVLKATDQEAVYYSLDGRPVIKTK